LLTSTRRENTLFGDCPPNAVGNPPSFRFEIRRENGVFDAFVRGRRRTTSRSSGLRRLRA
jgi:hypothetical protein